MSFRSTTAATISVAGLAFVAAIVACGEDRSVGFVPPTSGFEVDEMDAGNCPFQCSLDGRSVVRSCTGEVAETCRSDQACGAARCQEPCAAAGADKSSTGCEFYFQPPSTDYADSCYAAFVVNTSTQPVEISLEREGKDLDISKATFRTNPGDAALIPHTGAIAPGDSIVLFLSDHDPSFPMTNRDYIACPDGVTPALLTKQSFARTGVGASFHLKASNPVSLAAMFPFGGAASFMPSATLVLPVGSWAKQHMVVGSWESNPGVGNPTTQIVAAEDDTEVIISPSQDIQSGSGVKGAAAKVPSSYRLGRGQFLQFVQIQELSGSIITSNKPTTIFSGHTCVNIPLGAAACDTLGQQVPAFEQWGSEYVGVGYRPRLGNEHELMPYRIVAARDGTRLDYDPAIPVGAPTEMSAGQVVTFVNGTGDPFVVRTQDADHPIYLAAYMTGFLGEYYETPFDHGGAGDPEFVNVIPAGQYMNAYTFYADPTYPETSLVVVRAKSRGVFKDVWLECAGNLTDFRPIGTRGEYEFTRVDLARDRGPGQQFGDETCRTGLQRMKSDGPFTATLWGWGFAASYAYPGGMAHRKLVESPLVPVQ